MLSILVAVIIFDAVVLPTAPRDCTSMDARVAFGGELGGFGCDHYLSSRVLVVMRQSCGGGQAWVLHVAIGSGWNL